MKLKPFKENWHAYFIGTICLFGGLYHYGEALITGNTQGLADGTALFAAFYAAFFTDAIVNFPILTEKKHNVLDHSSDGNASAGP